MTTVGGDVDGDGYLVRVDGGTALRVSQGTTTLGDLEPGPHELTISDVADNCVVDGENPMAFTVARDQITQAALEVTCTAYRGSMRVEVETTGWDVDVGGYTLLVDGVEASPLDPTSTLTVPGVEPGEHAVTLGDVAPNCAVVIPRTRTVSVDSLQEAGVAFRVYCAAATGPSAEQIFLSAGVAGLVRVRSDGSDATYLPVTPRVADYPAWSPDRTRVIVSLYDMPRDEFGGTLWSVSPGGSDLDEIGAPMGAEDPNWSPDGSQLVYRARLPEVGLHVIRVDGSGDLRITTGEEDWMPAWSPDGTRIAFVRLDDPVHQLYTVRPDGSELTPVPIGDVRNAVLGPSWSPDGSRLAFSGYRDGEVGLWVVNDDGTGLTRLTPLDLEVYPEVTWSPTGDRLAMVGKRGDDVGLWTVRSDGSALTFRLSITAGTPAWGR
ncbi:MAG TPA: LpqB family beta-propeller domain-containing protein [Gemmatimonadales bacterium]|nr:LpqB family beta-propeller domain-containing protein [Gemmatimonadales bacterium]